MSKKLISYVFPVYNEEETLDKLYCTLNETLKKVEEKYEVEIIFVNDGSKDNSYKILKNLYNKDTRVKVINFSRNFGHAMALTAGLDYANGDAVIIMDSDLQDPPKVTLNFIKKWEEGYQVIYGKRKTRQDSFFKKLTAHVFYRLLDSLADIKIPKDTGDFRLMDRQVVNTFNKFREKNRFIRGIVPYVGYKQTAVEFDRNERYAGKSNYPLRKMIKLANDAITGFSTVPIKLVGRIGNFFIIVSVLLILFFIFTAIFTDWVINSYFIQGAMLGLFTGIQLFALGTIGSYVGRIYSEVQGRPLYIVAEFLNQEAKETYNI